MAPSGERRDSSQPVLPVTSQQTKHIRLACYTMGFKLIFMERDEKQREQEINSSDKSKYISVEWNFSQISNTKQTLAIFIMDSPLTVSRFSHHPLAVCNLITPSPARSAPEHWALRLAVRHLRSRDLVHPLLDLLERDGNRAVLHRRPPLQRGDPRVRLAPERGRLPETS